MTQSLWPEVKDEMSFKALEDQFKDDNDNEKSQQVVSPLLQARLIFYSSFISLSPRGVSIPVHIQIASALGSGGLRTGGARGISNSSTTSICRSCVCGRKGWRSCLPKLCCGALVASFISCVVLLRIELRQRLVLRGSSCTVCLGLSAVPLGIESVALLC